MIIATQDELLQNIMRDLKGYSAKQILKEIENNPQESRKEWMMQLFEREGQKNSNNTKFQFWQQHNHPLVLGNPIIFEQKLNYIHNNPIEAGFVEFPEHYPYSSAKDYADDKGLIDITLPN
jgi:hypothetical protein